MMLRYESRIASLEKEKIKVEVERLKAQNRISEFDAELRALKRCKDLEMQDAVRRLDADYRRLIDEIKERWDRKQQGWEHRCAFRQHEANYNLISDFKQKKYATPEDVMAEEERLLRKMEEHRAIFTEEPNLVVADLPFPKLPNVASEVLEASANPVRNMEVDATGVAPVLASDLPIPATAGEAQTVPVGSATVASNVVMQEPAIKSEELTN